MPTPCPLADTPFPGGRYTITRDENTLLCKAVGAVPATNDQAHPVFAYVATQAAMGWTVDELLALCGARSDDGPLITATRIDWLRPLIVERDYEVEGEIIDLSRKKSRTFGAVDTLDYRLRMRNGELVLTITNRWVIPRRGIDA